jgi:hypothetical protein
VAVLDFDRLDAAGIEQDKVSEQDTGAGYGVRNREAVGS